MIVYIMTLFVDSFFLFL